MSSDTLERLQQIDLTEEEEDLYGPLVTQYDRDHIHEVETDTPYKYWLSSYAKGRVMSNQNFILLVVGPTGCQPAGSKVLMADGEWKNIEDVKEGDLVLSPQHDGTHIYAEVLKTHEWFSDENYSILDRKRERILYTCSHNHEVAVHFRRSRRCSIRPSKWDMRNVPAKELAVLSNNTMRIRPVITSFKIDRFMERPDCKVEPYTLGIFLGDGCFHYKKKKTGNSFNSTLMIATNDKIIADEFTKHYEVRDVRKPARGNCKHYLFRIGGPLYNQLTELGLRGKKSGNKFIPKEAMWSSSEYRKKLLAGLIDSDGYFDGIGHSVVFKSKNLAEDISALVHSLGGKATMTTQPRTVLIQGKKIKRDYYFVWIYLRDINIPIKLKRKVRTKKKYTYKTANRRTIRIKKASSSTVYGFTLNSPSSWYITDNYVVTKNSGKSYSAMELSRDLDPGFTVDRIVFYSKDFIRVTKQGLPPGSVIMWDEVGVGLSAREWWSIQNKMIAYVLETFRRDRLVLIMTTPNVTFIDKKVRALLHGFAETIDKTFTGNKFGYVKYFHIISNLREGKTMYRYPRIRDKHGRTRVIRGKTATSGNMRFSMPPEWLWEPYEEVKKVFTESLKDDALELVSESSTSSKMEIEDIIKHLQENPQKYGLLDDTGITHIINKAFIKLSIQFKHKKITKSNVDACVRYAMQDEGIEVQADTSTLDDSMINTVRDLYETETDVRGVAKALGEDLVKVQRSIKRWKQMGVWSED